MALEVDITKKLDGFFMHMQFRAEQEIFARRVGLWKKHDLKVHRRNRKAG